VEVHVVVVKSGSTPETVVGTAVVSTLVTIAAIALITVVVTWLFSVCGTSGA